MFQQLRKALWCLFPFMLLLHQILAIPESIHSRGAEARATTTDVAFSSFVELISTGLHKAQSSFPAAQIFLVDAKPSFGTQSRNPSDFGNIELRLDDGGPTEITTRTFSSAAQIRWRLPERGHRLPRTYIKRFYWGDVGLDLDIAFDIAQASGSRGPWANVQILKYTEDVFYPPGQIYYRLTEPGLIESILIGLTTLKVYHEPYQVHHEDVYGKQQTNASAVQMRT